MDKLFPLMSELPSEKAEFVSVNVRYRDKKKIVKHSFDAEAWLIQRKGETVKIYTPYGRFQTFENGERTQINQSDVTVEVSIKPKKIDDLVKAVEASRAKGKAGSDLSEGGSLTGQFRGSGATLYEVILGVWLYRAKQDAEAARVLLPALDSLYRDQQLAQLVLHRLGEIYGYRMLVSFAGDRDFRETLRQAQAIDKLYPGSRFHEYAKEMIKQLPRREGDFVKLKLPTPAKWAEQKKKLTRSQQIDFLCERMRLLNCFQMGQPGGYSPDEKQYAEPCGIASDASWGLDRGKTEVINPLTELVGPVNGFDESKPRPRGLELTLKDVPLLSKYLRDDWYMLIVSFWRNFHPNRNLSSTRSQFAEIINGFAHKDICKTDNWGQLTPMEIDKEIDRINRWAKANADKKPVELEWDALTEEMAAGAEWNAISGRVESLLQQKQTKAYDVMRQFLENAKTDTWSRSYILQEYLHHDVTRAKNLAPKYLDSKERSLRFFAALIVFRTGEKTKARTILGNELASREVDGWAAKAVEALLQDGSAESKQQVVRLFANRHLRHERDGVRSGILRQCAAAGLKEPYDFYLPLLDINKEELPVLDEKGETSGTSYFQPTVAEAFAEEIVKQFAEMDAKVQAIAKKFPKTSDQIPHLKAWLRECRLR